MFARNITAEQNVKCYETSVRGLVKLKKIREKLALARPLQTPPPLPPIRFFFWKHVQQKKQH